MPVAQQHRGMVGVVDGHASERAARTLRPAAVAEIDDAVGDLNATDDGPLSLGVRLELEVADDIDVRGDAVDRRWNQLVGGQPPTRDLFADVDADAELRCRAILRLLQADADMRDARNRAQPLL